MVKFQQIILSLLLIFLLGSMEAYAQPLRIVMVETMPVLVVTDHEKFFLDGLTQLGYRIGETLIVDKIEAQGEADRAVRELQKYLSLHRPDVVVSFATLASQAANQVLAGTDIPLVFCVVSAPVKAGLIETVGKPTKTNVTGLLFSLMRQSKMDLAKTLLTQPFPDRPVRVGIVHSSYSAAVNDVKKINTIAQQDGKIAFKTYELKYRAMPDGLDEMIADARKGVTALSSEIDYWWIVPGPLGETAEFSNLLLESDIPVGLCHTKDCTQNGGLFFVNPSYKESGYQVAGIVNAILKGTAPGTITPTPPDSFDFGINLKTALDLHIVAPSNYMELAGKNIWR